MRKLLRLIEVFLIFTVLLTSCSSSSLNSKDEQYSYIKNFVYYICETDNSYYFLSGHAKCYLYIYDKMSKTAIPLCNKPNCKHTAETDGYRVSDCNAFLGNGPMFMQYNDGLVYYVLFDPFSDNGFRPTLYSVSLDGTNHRKVLDLKEAITSLVIHRDSIYYTTKLPQKTKDDDNQTLYRLYRQSLIDTAQKPALIEEGCNYGGAVARLLCYRNSVYYNVQYYKDNTFQETISNIFIYDIQSKTKKVMIENGSASYTVFNNQMVYRSFNDLSRTYMCDLDGSNSKEIPFNGGIYIANNKYLIIDNRSTENRKVIVLNRDLNTVKTILLDQSYYESIGCSDEYYFVGKNAGENNNGPVESIYAVPLNDDKADVTPRVFHEFVPETYFPGVNKKLN